MRKLYDDVSRAATYRICRGLDPVQPVPQNAGQLIHRKTHSGPLRGQVQKQFFLVIGKAVFHGGHFWVLRNGGFQSLCRVLEHLRLCPEKLHIQRVPPRARAPTTEADHLCHRVLAHLVL